MEKNKRRGDDVEDRKGQRMKRAEGFENRQSERRGNEEQRKRQMRRRGSESKPGY